jgi:hypothetical protein
VGVYIINQDGLSDLLISLHIDEKDVINVEYSLSQKIKEVRADVGQIFEMLRVNLHLSCVFRRFDELTDAKQNLFLKPLEECRDETNVFLEVQNINFVLPTIRSRCIEKVTLAKPVTDCIWSDRIIKSWRLGVAEVISVMDEIEEDDILQVVSSLIAKMRGVVEENLSSKRLRIMSELLAMQNELINLKVGARKNILQARIARIMTAID